MNAKKKILSVALAAALTSVAIVGSSLAYFTDRKEATNTLTIGNVKIDLTEPNWEATGEEEAEEMYPGEAVAKDPTVANIGANPAFVRVKVIWPEDVVLSYRTDYQDNQLGKNWVYNDTDGYFYYSKVLDINETTDALFDQIVLSTDTTNGDTAVDYDVVVVAEAIQAQGAADQWSRVETMTVEEIAVWFTTQTQIALGA